MEAIIQLRSEAIRLKDQIDKECQTIETAQRIVWQFWASSRICVAEPTQW